MSAAITEFRSLFKECFRSRVNDECTDCSSCYIYTQDDFTSKEEFAQHRLDCLITNRYNNKQLVIEIMKLSDANMDTRTMFYNYLISVIENKSEAHLALILECEHFNLDLLIEVITLLKVEWDCVNYLSLFHKSSPTRLQVLPELFNCICKNDNVNLYRYIGQKCKEYFKQEDELQLIYKLLKTYVFMHRSKRIYCYCCVKIDKSIEGRQQLYRTISTDIMYSEQNGFQEMYTFLQAVQNKMLE